MRKNSSNRKRSVATAFFTSSYSRHRSPNCMYDLQIPPPPGAGGLWCLETQKILIVMKFRDELSLFQQSCLECEHLQNPLIFELTFANTSLSVAVALGKSLGFRAHALQRHDSSSGFVCTCKPSHLYSHLPVCLPICEMKAELDLLRNSVEATVQSGDNLS